ncbi:unnamed protein product [Rotaria socialis]|uniref:Uncharacterized protein n=1 Tax=Rotaria socialis TaxID=392032 RepID=A0A818VK70_9BILA|nr:unnamed protein product [Rotaria socialis]CAF4876069.1 unnamed protein product [Rotaria socialis]
MSTTRGYGRSGYVGHRGDSTFSSNSTPSNDSGGSSNAPYVGFFNDPYCNGTLGGSSGGSGGGGSSSCGGGGSSCGGGGSSCGGGSS